MTPLLFEEKERRKKKWEWNRASPSPRFPIAHWELYIVPLRLMGGKRRSGFNKYYPFQLILRFFFCLAVQGPKKWFADRVGSGDRHRACGGRRPTAWRSASCECWKESDWRRASLSGRDFWYQDLLFQTLFCVHQPDGWYDRAGLEACLSCCFEISAWELMGSRVSLLASPFYYVAFSMCNLE